jgi:hypothetical protein
MQNCFASLDSIIRIDKKIKNNAIHDREMAENRLLSRLPVPAVRYQDRGVSYSTWRQKV